MSEFTKGPWECYADLPSTEPNWHIVTGHDRMRVVANVHIEPGNKRDEADARLITAAPELYEALSELADCDFGATGGAERFERAAFIARSALAKARGEA